MNNRTNQRNDASADPLAAVAHSQSGGMFACPDIWKEGDYDSRTKVTLSRDSSLVGQVCGREFTTKGGRSLHRRKGHPESYMTELESQHQEQLTQPKAGKGKKIDQLELEHLARVEAGLELMRGTGSQSVSDRTQAQELSDTGLTERSFEALRKIVIRDDFKTLVAQFKLEAIELRQAVEGEPVATTTDAAEPSEQPATADLDQQDEPSQVELRREEWVRLMHQALQSDVGNGLLSQEQVRRIVPGSYCPENLALIDELYLEFTLKWPCSQRRRRPAMAPTLPVQARKRRRALYRRTQRLWRKNRARCAHQVVDGDWDKAARAGVDLRKLEEFWRPLLETESVPDSRVPETGQREEAWDTVAPITVEEVKASLSACEKNTAPGPDGRKVANLVKIPARELCMQLNLWLLSGCLPTVLCEGRTTLIEKEAGTTDPKKFRPITVTSLAARVYDRILAQRLERSCPVSDRQKAFRTMDGCAENIYLLRGIIARATDSKSPSSLYLAFIDVKKAYDSVSHESLLLACKRMGMPEPLVEYVRAPISEVTRD